VIPDPSLVVLDPSGKTSRASIVRRGIGRGGPSRSGGRNRAGIGRAIRDRIHGAHDPSGKTNRVSIGHLVRRLPGRSREATRAARTGDRNLNGGTSLAAIDPVIRVPRGRSGVTKRVTSVREGRSPIGEINPATTVRVILDRIHAAHGPNGKISRASIVRLEIVPEGRNLNGGTSRRAIGHRARSQPGGIDRKVIVRVVRNPNGEIVRRAIDLADRSLNGRTATSHARHGRMDPMVLPRVTRRRAKIAGDVTGGPAASTKIRAIGSRCRAT
jgi:hypothetical protein